MVEFVLPMDNDAILVLSLAAEAAFNHAMQDEYGYEGIYNRLKAILDEYAPVQTVERFVEFDYPPVEIWF